MHRKSKSLFHFVLVAFMLLATGLAQTAGAQGIREIWRASLDDAWSPDSPIARDLDGNLIVSSVKGNENAIAVFKYAPNGTRLWVRYVNIDGVSPLVTGSAADSSGNVVVVALANDGTASVRSIVVKLDRDGNLLWNQAFQPDINDYFYTVAVDAGGNIFAGGFGDGNGYARGLLTKFSPGGDVLWTDPSTWFVGKVLVDSVGCVHTAGANENGSMETAKFDSDGSLIWRRTATPGYSIDMAFDAAGNIYALGLDGYTDAPIVAKFDPEGNPLWEKYIDSSVLRFDPTFAVDPQGNAYVAGLHQIDSTHFDTGTVKLDSAGGLVWANHFGLRSNRGLNFTPKVLADPTGGAIVSTNEAPVNPTHTGDLVTVKYDDSGNLLWSLISAGPSFNGTPGEMVTDLAGNVYLTCSISGANAQLVKIGLNQAPVLSVPPTAAVNVGCPVTAQASASDPENDAVTFSLVGAPGWASINASTGLITLNPPSGTNGPFNFTVRATDTFGAVDQKGMTVNVSPILISGVSISKKNGIVTVQFTVSNTDGTIVNNVSLNSATLKGIATQTGMPISYPQLKQGVSKTVQLKFSNVPSGAAQLIISGTSSAGPANANLTISVP